MFEAFYNSLKPVDLILMNFEVVKAGKIWALIFDVFLIVWIRKDPQRNYRTPF